MRAARSEELASAPALAGPQADLLRATWALAWPVIFSFSIESLTGLCDTLMVGRLGKTAVAAVGVGVQILSIVNTALFAVGIGTVAIVARHVGAGDRRGAEDALVQSIFAALGLSLVAAVPVAVWAPSVIAAYRVDSAVVAAGTPFLRVALAAAPLEAVLFVVISSLRGAGDMRTPLAIGVVVGLLNVLTAYTFIFGHFGLPALGVTGAALATPAAFAVGVALGLALLARCRLRLALHRHRLVLEPEVMRRVLRIGTPAALEHLLMQIGFLFYVVFAARYGTASVAAYFIGVRIMSLSFLPGFGFAAAAATMVGQSLGARRPSEAEHSGWAATRLAVCLMTAGGMVLFVAARSIARLFVDDPAVVTDAVAFIRVLAASQPLMAIDFTLGGALRGAGDTRFPLLTVLVAFYGCRLGFSAAVTWGLGLPVVWLWLALVGDYLARSLLKGWRFQSGRWRHVRV